MKRTITVSASFSGKISVGQYENAQPFFAVSEVQEWPDDTMTDTEVAEYVKRRQVELQAICGGNFAAEVTKALINKIKADRKDFHWGGPDGTYPSVTSVLGYDSDFFKSDDEMKEYAAQGNIIHAQIHELVKTGVWKDPKEIEGIAPDIFILLNGKLGLSLEGWDFPGFVKKYKVTEMENGEKLASDKYRICGTPDIPRCKVDGVWTLADVKRTADKTKNFQQMAAYEMMRRENGLPPNDQIAIFVINDKTEQGYSKPITTTAIDKYFEMFLYKRKAFEKVYGV